ncbi:MAG: hypothetical protein HY667_05710 [Chloroflexi bacterium]|nr:hypothetical protein [Chloroflexota bacterium]
MTERITGTRKFSDETVRRRTGKDWAEWFLVLDDFGRKQKGHKAAAKYLEERYGLDGWWAQMVTVRYEWERGLRQ